MAISLYRVWFPFCLPIPTRTNTSPVRHSRGCVLACKPSATPRTKAPRGPHTRRSVTRGSHGGAGKQVARKAVRMSRTKRTAKPNTSVGRKKGTRAVWKQRRGAERPRRYAGPMRWTYGVTTVPERFDDLLPQGLYSLASGHCGCHWTLKVKGRVWHCPKKNGENAQTLA